MKAYKAYGAQGDCASKSTPKAAAEAYFEKYPSSRKCDVVEGTTDGVCFTLACHIARPDKRPQSWKGVTKKSASQLPVE